MAKLFQTGNSINENTVNVGLELADNVWLKAALLQALILMGNPDNWQQDGDATIDFARDKSNEMYVSVLFNMQLNPPVIGSYLMCAAEIQPPGYLVCDGSAVSRETYVDLFNVIMTNYGAGDGTTTFNIPDFRDMSPMGSSGAVVGQPGAVQGALEITLDTTQIPSHNHTVNDTGHTHILPRASGTAGGSVQRPATPVNTALEPHTALTDVGLTGISLNNTGGGSPHSNLHPVMGVQMLIYTGVLE